MNQNYRVYTQVGLGNTEEDYEIELEHVVYYVQNLKRANYWAKSIHRVNGKVFNHMTELSFAYDAKASLDLLIDNDPYEFRKHAYIAGKLGIMGNPNYDLEIVGCTDCVTSYPQFCIVMCDNEDLIQYMLKYEQSNKRPYEKYNNKPDLIIPFLTSDWDSIELILKYQQDHPPVKRSTKVRKDQYEIYIRFIQAVLNQDQPAMSDCLQSLLEKRFIKRYSDLNPGVNPDFRYNLDVDFYKFYLKPYVLILAKIAMRHGWDLGIDHPCAPKELIEIRPLPTYDDPYDFMRELDYQRPYSEWVNLWRERMEAKKAKEEQKAILKARYCSIKGIFNCLKDKFKDRA